MTSALYCTIQFFKAAQRPFCCQSRPRARCLHLLLLLCTEEAAEGREEGEQEKWRNSQKYIVYWKLWKLRKTILPRSSSVFHALSQMFASPLEAALCIITNNINSFVFTAASCRHECCKKTVRIISGLINCIQPTQDQLPVLPDLGMFSVAVW